MPIQIWKFYDGSEKLLGESGSFADGSKQFPYAVFYKYFENGKYVKTVYLGGFV